MRPVALLLAAVALFAGLPYAQRSGATVGALVPMLTAVAFAVAVAGRPSGLGVSLGAVAAFAGSFAWALAPVLAGALVVLLAYVERTFRVRTARARILHVVLAAAGGAAAGGLSSAYASAPVAIRSVALALVAVLCTLPFLVEADDPRVALLEAAAARLGVPLAPVLREAADLLRSGGTGELDRETAARVRSSWRALERLIEARLRLRGAPRSEHAAQVTSMLDRQITEHVTSLVRAVAAATTMGAAEAGLDDTAMRDVHIRGEVLEEQGRAMLEVRTR